MLVLGSVTLRKILLLDQFIAWKHSICIQKILTETPELPWTRDNLGG